MPRNALRRPRAILAALAALAVAASVGISAAPAVAATTPVMTFIVPTVAAYDDIDVSIAVRFPPPAGAYPTGSVTFTSGGQVLGTISLLSGDGVATLSMPQAAVGSAVTIVAHYAGDSVYEAASAEKTVTLVAPTARGTVTWNEVAIANATVRLLETDRTTVVASTTTDATGGFSLGPGAITTRADAEKAYVLDVAYPHAGTFFVSASGPTTDGAQAREFSPLTWGANIAVDHVSGPVWTEQQLPSARVGVPYSGQLTAYAPEGGVTYSVTGPSRPASRCTRPGWSTAPPRRRERRTSPSAPPGRSGRPTICTLSWCSRRPRRRRGPTPSFPCSASGPPWQTG